MRSYHRYSCHPQLLSSPAPALCRHAQHTHYSLLFICRHLAPILTRIIKSKPQYAPHATPPDWPKARPGGDCSEAEVALVPKALQRTKPALIYPRQYLPSTSLTHHPMSSQGQTFSDLFLSLSKTLSVPPPAVYPNEKCTITISKLYLPSCLFVPQPFRQPPPI